MPSDFTATHPGTGSKRTFLELSSPVQEQRPTAFLHLQQSVPLLSVLFWFVSLFSLIRRIFLTIASHCLQVVLHLFSPFLL
nr:MAG TPA: hypothetical protein [Caudoviricetes sp.]